MLHGSLTTSDLADVDQLALIIDMDDGFKLQHGTNDRGGSADTSAAFEMHQIVYGDPVAQLQLMIFHPGGELVQRETFVTLFAGMGDQQALAKSGTAGIDYIDLTLRILLFQFISGNHSGLVGGGKRRGEA